MIIMIGTALVLVLLVIPIPALALDILLAVNLLFALTMLLIVFRTKKTTVFIYYPTMLLLSICFGLAVNLAATRLILIKGVNFDGMLINTLASLVTKFENTGLVMELVFFIVLNVIQMTVVVKGSTRIAEIAARFTLDALPAKQMTIEAEYNSGAITEEEAVARKNELQKEVDFYGTMDGSSKFISGNEKVRILIIAVSIIGGILIGVLYKDESIIAAIRIYIPLIISNGILCLIPSFLLSLTAGYVIALNISL